MANQDIESAQDGEPAAAGDAGGTIVATGPPEEVARSERSRTAPYLAERLPTSSLS